MNRSSALAMAGVLFVAGCGAKATQPPKQLADARIAYEHAADDPAVMLVPDDLAEARRSLDAAERSFQEHGEGGPTESLAYVAQRRAVAVRAKGNAMQALEQKRVALAELDRLRARHAAASREEIEREGRLAQTEREAAERRARAAAEEKVLQELCEIQGIKAEESARGVILTLSGDELFRAGQTQLMPKAKQRLDQLASVLKEDGRTLFIAGYTDSTGSDRLNERLSTVRAEAVRRYLIDQGIEARRIRAEGLGELQPIADNATPEGRAANRRIEIVVERSPGSGVPPEIHEQR